MNIQTPVMSGILAAPVPEPRRVPACPIRTQDTELERMKQSWNWFIGIRTTGGEKRFFSKGEYAHGLRRGILEGEFRKDSIVDIHVKSPEGRWQKTSSLLVRFARGRFKLGVLYAPVWKHAMAGLKWGALAGITLKLLDTLLLFGSVDPGLGLMFVASMGACLMPRAGMFAMILLSVYLNQVPEINLFLTVLAAALVGALLGSLPGMALGGGIGFVRRGTLPVARDARPEPRGLLLKTVVLPLMGAVALWVFYFQVFSPWIMEGLEKQ